MHPMTLQTLLDSWQADDETAPNCVTWRTLPPRPADLRPFPPDLPPVMVNMLHAQGIFELYSHQAESWEAARRGENVVISTSTASGKTLAYNLPVLTTLTENPAARALYLYPTKALAQDQLSGIGKQVSGIKSQVSGAGEAISAAIYDGDTPAAHRADIRKRANIVLSNPDMLHTGILPHHTVWAEFFANLRYIIIDEAHSYRGVFGSHVANVLRRLLRIARFYGAKPRFLLASATIGNPQELAERLTEQPVTWVRHDGSARGPRHFIIYNPPVTEPSIGLRKSSVMEAVRLAGDMLKHNVQAVIFGRSRRGVEILLTYLQGVSGSKAVRGYRSGYLPTQRREIEKGLRDGSVRAVVATNALELGIDIGGLGAALLVGYPGSVASAWQQAGRAGRGLDPAAAVLVASPSPLDQFLARNPSFLLDRPAERALLNPDHLLILLNHLRCAIFELPFGRNEGFGNLSADIVREYLEVLAANGEAHASAEKFFWMADAYPAAQVSLRSASPESVVLQAANADGESQVIGTVDSESACWFTHPGAIYLHEAQAYFVEKLDLTEKRASLKPIASDYYTEALRSTEVQILSETTREKARGAEKAWGELQVTTQVTGFRKLRWYSRENLGEEPLSLPPSELQTTGYWLSIAPETVRALSRDGLWTNTPNDYGPTWPKIREKARARDGYQCQMCGLPESGRQHDVHHITPFRMFRDETGAIQRERANRLENLVTLCPECHKKAEVNVRVRSGLAGLGFVLGQLAPLFLMCDSGDLGVHTDGEGAVFGQPSVVLYDLVPAGIGFSEQLFKLHGELVSRARELVTACPCEDGCPACVGPAGENGLGGKQETLALLRLLGREDEGK